VLWGESEEHRTNPGTRRGRGGRVGDPQNPAPADFSDNSQAAFRLACALARDYEARLLVLHVSTPFVAYGEGVVTAPPPDFTEELRARLQKIRPGDPRVTVEHKLVEGDPAAEILRVAREAGCDLILLGTHGRTGPSRLLMGSVAEVVRRASCPVLAVKTLLVVVERAGQPEVAGAAH
jgi:nucleotide-binding universal stress UspA family protein